MDKKITGFQVQCFIIIAVVSILPLLTGCDYEKFIGYDNEGQELLETTRVYGRIIHYYTHKPVNYARVQVGGQETLTNVNGEYALNYLLSDDERRNKSTPIKISAANYFPVEFEEVLSPVENEFSYRLKYAAPIVEKAIRRTNPVNRNELVCQAVVTDYQGPDNLEQVAAYYPLQYYDGSKDTLETIMNMVGIKGPYTFYYQSKVMNQTGFDLAYRVIAVDKDEFSHTLARANNPFREDTLLFEIAE